MKTYFKKIFALAFLLTAFLTIIAQSEIIEVSGVVRDAKTRDRVANAAITVPGTSVGTVTNSDGGFLLKIPQNLKTKEFQISHISYVVKSVVAADYTQPGKTILLDPQVVVLSEIMVSPTDARNIVMKAFEQIQKNYSGIPNKMMGFYRESIRQRREYISVSEAVVDVYKEPYTNPMNDEVRILKGRKGQNVKKADTLNVMLQGGPSVLLWIDVAKNPTVGVDLLSIDNYSFSYQQTVQVDDAPNFVIEFRPAKKLDYPLYYGNIYIQKNNYAITRVEFHLDLSNPKLAASQFIKRKPAGTVFVPTETNYLVTFKSQEGKYFLNYMRVDLKFKSDWKRKLFKNNYTISSEMAITERKQGAIAKIPNSERFKPTMILNNEVSAFFDKEFWGEHNIIEPEHAIEHAIRKISKKMNN